MTSSSSTNTAGATWVHPVLSVADATPTSGRTPPCPVTAFMDNSHIITHSLDLYWITILLGTLLFEGFTKHRDCGPEPAAPNRNLGRAVHSFCGHTPCHLGTLTRSSRTRWSSMVPGAGSHCRENANQPNPPNQPTQTATQRVAVFFYLMTAQGVLTCWSDAEFWATEV